MELNHTVSVLITSGRFLITELNKNDNIFIQCTVCIYVIDILVNTHVALEQRETKGELVDMITLIII